MICLKSTEELALPFVGQIVIDHSAEFTIKKRLSRLRDKWETSFP